eukprot:s1673_g24.t1
MDQNTEKDTIQSPQVCSLRAVADQAGSTGSWQDAIRLLEEAQRQRSAASMEVFEEAAELSRIQDAPRAAPRVEKLLEEARKSKLNPTRRLYEAVVMSYGDAESWEQALFWLLEVGTPQAAVEEIQRNGKELQLA